MRIQGTKVVFLCGEKLMNNKIIESRGTPHPEFVRKIQQKISKTFPNGFREMVSNYDRPIFEKEIINFYSEEAQCIDQTSLGIIFSFDSEYPYEKFIDNLNHPPEFFPENLIAFGRDGTGNLFCFDYRENPETDNPPIVLWHVEGDGISFIAKDFDELINNLKSEEEAMQELEKLRNRKQ